jgi:hypothetical protein
VPTGDIAPASLSEIKRQPTAAAFPILRMKEVASVVVKVIVEIERNDVGLGVEVPDTDLQNEYQLLQEALWN